MDNVKIHEPLCSSEHNQKHFDINVKSKSKNMKTYMRNFHKCIYKDMRKYLGKLDWNNVLMDKTAIKCWNILLFEIESTIDKFVLFEKNKENGLERNTCRNKLFKNSVQANYVEGSYAYKKG